MCDGDQSQKVLNGTGKKGCSIVCFAIGMPRLSMQQCLEIWLTVLSDLSCKLDVLSSALTLTDIMKPLPKVEPGRDDTSWQSDFTAGGFSSATQTESPNPDTDTSHLEEADTKVFL